MIPNVFISSTIADLQHLREALKDTVEELSYHPILSEFGDVGYLPQASAETSCYLAMRDCQMAVLIVGKRYGSLAASGLGITHSEFLTARENTIPVICLVDREVLSYKKVFDATGEAQTTPVFPGMDFPGKTFSFIQEVMDAPVNNGILPYSSIAEVRALLKTQLAHVFGDLLRSRFDPVRTGIKDVLSEVMTLRQELRNKDMDPQPFLRATRFLLDDENKELRDFIEHISGSVEISVPLLLRCRTFEEYIAETKTEITIDETPVDMHELTKKNDLVTLHRFLIPRQGIQTLDGQTIDEQVKVAQWGILRGKRATMNSIAKRLFDYSYESLRKAAGV
jgi:hypothetical protein